MGLGELSPQARVGQGGQTGDPESRSGWAPGLLLPLLSIPWLVRRWGTQVTCRGCRKGLEKCTEAPGGSVCWQAVHAPVQASLLVGLRPRARVPSAGVGHRQGHKAGWGVVGPGREPLPD